MYKILIVEDEAIIRDSIARYIDKSEPDFEVIGKAENGLKALEVFEHELPDVVVTDVLMPNMNGIEFIRKVREKNKDIKIVIISGHDEFAFVQTAMSLNVTDYLLKPFLPEKLVATLNKVKTAIDNQRNFYKNMDNLQKRLDESMPIVRERFYNDLVSDVLYMEEIRHKCNFLDIDVYAEFYTVAIIKLKNHNVASANEFQKEEKIQFFLMDTVGQLFDQQIKTFVFCITTNQIGIIICGSYDYKYQFSRYINRSLTKLMNSMANYYDVLIYASVGKLYEDISKLPQAYNEAKEAMAYSFVREANSVINYDDIFLDGAKNYVNPSSLIKDIILNAKIEKEADAIYKIKELFQYYVENGIMEQNFIKTDVIDIIIALQRYVEESKGNSYFLYKYNISPYEQIQRVDTMYELRNLLESFIGLTIQEISVIREGHSYNIIEKLKSITALNISNEEFNLDCAASMLYISPNYLRQLFKEQTGQTFLEYLTAERMKKAAELIENHAISISDISEKVGYCSQSYFSKCFKKYFCVAPSEYRKEQMLN